MNSVNDYGSYSGQGSLMMGQSSINPAYSGTSFQFRMDSTNLAKPLSMHNTNTVTTLTTNSPREGKDRGASLNERIAKDTKIGSVSLSNVSTPIGVGKRGLNTHSLP